MGAHNWDRLEVNLSDLKEEYVLRTAPTGRFKKHDRLMQIIA